MPDDWLEQRNTTHDVKLVFQRTIKLFRQEPTARVVLQRAPAVVDGFVDDAEIPFNLNDCHRIEIAQSLVDNAAHRNDFPFVSDFRRVLSPRCVTRGGTLTGGELADCCS